MIKWFKLLQNILHEQSNLIYVPYIVLTFKNGLQVQQLKRFIYINKNKNII